MKNLLVGFLIYNKRNVLHFLLQKNIADWLFILLLLHEIYLPLAWFFQETLLMDNYLQKILLKMY